MNERDGPGICRRWQLIVAVCGSRDRPLNYVILSEADVILSGADVILSEAGVILSKAGVSPLEGSR